jgi:Na+/H+ antiporter NhaC
MLKATFAGIAILYCAWMIAAASSALGTATYLTELLGDRLAPQLLPSLLFLLACGVSFATGTSWGTMSMLLPLVIGLSFSIGEGRFALGGGHGLMVMSVAAVIEGAIFGDHCSPLASTTILSSISSSADLVDHVRTQLPYGLLALALTLTVGWFPCAFLGWSPWLALGVGCALLLMIVLVFGRRVEPAPVEAPASTAPEP